MALTNATIDGAWTLQLKNVALQGRFFAGAFLAEANASTTSLSKYRAGVVPKDSSGGIFGDGQVKAKGSPSLSLDVNPGYFIIDRPSQGPYVAFSSAVVSVTAATADATNPRLDLIVARVEDTGIGDSNLWAQIQVITGTPAGSPVAPSAPAGSIPLATARVDALATTITNAKITDLRKSAGVAGGVRRLLPGDALADVGFYDGELRDTSTGIDRWTDASSSWVPVGAPFASATARGAMGVHRPTASVTGSGTTEKVGCFVTFNAINGRRYKATYNGELSSSNTNTNSNLTTNPGVIRMRVKAGSDGTAIDGSVFDARDFGGLSNGYNLPVNMAADWVAGATQQVTIVATFAAASGAAGNLSQAYSATNHIPKLIVEDIGV